MEEKEKRREEILYEEDEIDLYELWQKLVKRKGLIFGLTFFITVLAGVISFLMTPIYRSEAVLMPVSSKPLAGFAELASQFLGVPVQADDTSSKIITILKSRTIKERVIKEENLIPVLVEEVPENRDPLSAAVEIMNEMVKVSTDRKTGAIKLAVEYKDPEIAKRIAEAYIRELQEIMEEKSLTIAKVNRIFLERQLIETEKELQEKLAILTEFQRREKIIVPQEQVKGAFTLYSELLSKKLTLQIELRRLESVLSPDSPKIKYLREQIDAINRQLEKLENSPQEFSAIPTLETAPEKLAEYTQLYVKVKALQAKYETLLKLYEQAKLEEQREAIYVEVIDPPSLPDIPVKPKKKLIVAVAFVSALFFAIFLALFLEWLETVRQRHKEEGIITKGEG